MMNNMDPFVNAMQAAYVMAHQIPGMHQMPHMPAYSYPMPVMQPYPAGSDIGPGFTGMGGYGGPGMAAEMMNPAMLSDRFNSSLKLGGSAGMQDLNRRGPPQALYGGQPFLEDPNRRGPPQALYGGQPFLEDPNRRGSQQALYGGQAMQQMPLAYEQSQGKSLQQRSQQGRGRGFGGMEPHGGNVGMPASGPAGGRPPRRQRSNKGLEDNVRRTVYISYLDQQVTEEQLAIFFQECGKVLDCRICGDPNSAMRFAFIEFSDFAGATAALSKTGSDLGSSSLRVLPSKTAIVPVNRELMPRSTDELERCSRTVYAANIDKKVDKNDVKHFFEQLCGQVNRIRLLGDFAHSTRIAFIEFVEAEGAMAALNCSGALLGSLPVRVSPSKTPVRVEGKEDEAED